MKYTIKTPEIVKTLYRDALWNFKTDKNVLYLTFDDGPTIGVTENILDVLQTFSAHATFFCVGKNVKKAPELFQKIKNNGHSVGNHTFNHLNGWKSSTSDYVKSFTECHALVGGSLFRPPYGRIKRAQIKQIIPTHQLIMWDVLSGDFNNSLTPEVCYRNIIKNAKKGSIIVMHDSVKAKDKVLPTLPRVLKYYTDEGWQFKSIEY